MYSTNTISDYFYPDKPNEAVFVIPLINLRECAAIIDRVRKWRVFANKENGRAMIDGQYMNVRYKSDEEEFEVKGFNWKPDDFDDVVRDLELVLNHQMYLR